MLRRSLGAPDTVVMISGRAGSTEWTIDIGRSSSRTDTITRAVPSAPTVARTVAGTSLVAPTRDHRPPWISWPMRHSPPLSR